MLTLHIDNQEIEQSLLSQFKNMEEIKNYFCALVAEDIEDRRLSELLRQDDKREFVAREEVFTVLDGIK